MVELLTRCRFIHLFKSKFVLFPVKLFGNATIDESEVYWINVWIENHLIEMPYDNRERCQHSFVKVNGESDVDPPARQKSEHADLEPNHQARQAHNECTPNDGPILGFLGITNARNFRLPSLDS